MGGFGLSLGKKKRERLSDFDVVCSALFNDVTRDSIANNFVIGVYCRCL